MSDHKAHDELVERIASMERELAQVKSRVGRSEQETILLQRKLAGAGKPAPRKERPSRPRPKKKPADDNKTLKARRRAVLVIAGSAAAALIVLVMFLVTRTKGNETKKSPEKLAVRPATEKAQAGTRRRAKARPRPKPKPNVRRETHRKARSKRIGLVRSCLNVADASVRNIWRQYQSTLDTKTGLPVRAWSNLSFLKVKIIHNCQRKLKIVEPQVRLVGVSEHIPRFQTTLAALVPLFLSARDYHNDKDYEQDGFKKAREDHGRLVKAFTRYLRTTDAIRRAMPHHDKWQAAYALSKVSEAARRDPVRRAVESYQRLIFELLDVILLPDSTLEQLGAAIAALVDLRQRLREADPAGRGMDSVQSIQKELSRVIKAAKALHRAAKKTKGGLSSTQITHEYHSAVFYCRFDLPEP